ncbi:MAG: PQQ-binding-like beta-propeller repeat protein [Muribaculaceae bacterium]|nr:PQQ-binding-like beta-propeller repeat protein [Muribaculaceae bacterium]
MKLKTLLFSLCLLFSLITSQAARIIVLADLHVLPGNECEAQLRLAVNEINQSNADAVVIDGDLTNEGSDEQLTNVKTILDLITKPQFMLPGNHETNWSQSATKTIFDLWGNDRFVTELDSLILIGIACGPYMKMGDGHIKQEDLHWLNATLQERCTPGKRVISFNHYPLLKDLDNFDDYTDVLKQYPVIAHVNGHYHKYEKYQSENGNINCMMVRSLDMKKGNYGYTIMDITADSVVFFNKRIGQEPMRVDGFAITLPDATTQPAERETSAIASIHTDSASIFTRLGFDKERIYFGNSLGYAKAIDKNTSELLWSIPTGASLFARPVVAGKYVVVPSAAKELLWIDRKSGEIVQRGESNGAYVADGLCVGNSLYLGGYMKMEKWDVKNRRLIWRFDSINNYCQAAPVVDGKDLIFGAWDSYLYCLDNKTGKLRWKWNNGKQSNMLGPGNVVPVVTKDIVFIVAPDRYMTAIDRNTGETIWRNNDHKYRESLGVSNDGKRVYAKTMDGELVAVDATSREFNELWLVDLGLGYEHAPCIVAEDKEGMIYTGSRRGIVVKVNPKTKEISTYYIGKSEINGIDIDPTTGNAYVSLIEGTIFNISR